LIYTQAGFPESLGLPTTEIHHGTGDKETAKVSGNQKKYRDEALLPDLALLRLQNISL